MHIYGAVENKSAINVGPSSNGLLAVENGGTLTLASGATVTVSSGSTFTVAGELDSTGVITVDNGATMTSTGSIIVREYKSATDNSLVDGLVINGNATLAELDSTGGIAIAGTATITELFNSNQTKISGSANITTLRNREGEFDISGTAEINTLENVSDSSIVLTDSSAKCTIKETVASGNTEGNNGTITVKAGSLIITGAFTNNNTIDTSGGSFKVTDSSVLLNAGAINGSLELAGTLKQSVTDSFDNTPPILYNKGDTLGKLILLKDDATEYEIQVTNLSDLTAEGITYNLVIYNGFACELNDSNSTIAAAEFSLASATDNICKLTLSTDAG